MKPLPYEPTFTKEEWTRALEKSGRHTRADLVASFLADFTAHVAERPGAKEELYEYFGFKGKDPLVAEANLVAGVKELCVRIIGTPWVDQLEKLALSTSFLRGMMGEYPDLKTKQMHNATKVVTEAALRTAIECLNNHFGVDMGLRDGLIFISMKEEPTHVTTYNLTGNQSGR